MFNRRQTFSAIVFPLVLGLTSACDFAELLPETADGAGTTGARVDVQLASVGTEDLDPEVQAVAIEVVDVLIHRSSDDTWLILNSDQIEFNLTDLPRSANFNTVPLAVGEYDSVQVTIDNGRVASDGKWRRANLPTHELTFEDAIYLDQGTRLRIEFDLEDGLVGAGAVGWTLTPQLRVTTEQVQEPGLIQ